MSEYVYLVGAEDVRKAGSAMQEAAGQMQHAANEMSEAIQRHERVLSDHRDALEVILKAHVEQVKEVMAPICIHPQCVKAGIPVMIHDKAQGKYRIEHLCPEHAADLLKFVEQRHQEDEERRN